MDVIVTALHTWTLLHWLYESPESRPLRVYEVGIPSKVFPKELQQLQLSSARPLRVYKVGIPSKVFPKDLNSSNLALHILPGS